MNITIRFPMLADQQFFIEAMQASQNLHHPWVEAPTTAKSFAAFIQKYQLDNNISYLVLADDKIAGVININQIIRGCFKSAFLGYYAVSGFAGKGVMSQGLKLVLQKAFHEHDLHRLEANIQPDNIASIRLVEKAGFVNEGYSKNYLEIDGAWRDHERWAMTKEFFSNYSLEEKGGVFEDGALKGLY